MPAHHMTLFIYFWWLRPETASESHHGNLCQVRWDLNIFFFLKCVMSSWNQYLETFLCINWTLFLICIVQIWIKNTTDAVVTRDDPFVCSVAVTVGVAVDGCAYSHIIMVYKVVFHLSFLMLRNTQYKGSFVLRNHGPHLSCVKTTESEKRCVRQAWSGPEQLSGSYLCCQACVLWTGYFLIF